MDIQGWFIDKLLLIIYDILPKKKKLFPFKFYFEIQYYFIIYKFISNIFNLVNLHILK